MQSKMWMQSKIKVVVVVEDDNEKETVLKDAEVSSPGCDAPIPPVGSEIIFDEPRHSSPTFCRGCISHQKSSLNANLIHVLHRPLC